jgi:hypothetical protein
MGVFDGVRILFQMCESNSGAERGRSAHPRITACSEPYPETCLHSPHGITITFGAHDVDARTRRSGTPNGEPARSSKRWTVVTMS